MSSVLLKTLGYQKVDLSRKVRLNFWGSNSSVGAVKGYSAPSSRPRRTFRWLDAAFLLSTPFRPQCLEHDTLALIWERFLQDGGW
jgi:hypothetical protein